MPIRTFSSVPAFYSFRRSAPSPSARGTPCSVRGAASASRLSSSTPTITYGVDAFRVIYEELGKLKAEGEATMVGYRLDKTSQRTRQRDARRVPCDGREARPRCGDLQAHRIPRRYHPRRGQKPGRATSTRPISPVSMNFWGFTPWIFTKLVEYFNAFLHALPAGELKRECLLPSMVGKLIEKGELRVSVLHIRREMVRHGPITRIRTRSPRRSGRCTTRACTRRRCTDKA